MVNAYSELWLTRAFTLFLTFRRDAPFNQTVDTLHCRADGKDNKHTWEKWFLDMCVCVFAWYMGMSQPSEWCWCSAYCSHPLLHTHSHAHSAIVTSAWKVKGVKVPVDNMSLCLFPWHLQTRPLNLNYCFLTQQNCGKTLNKVIYISHLGKFIEKHNAYFKECLFNSNRTWLWQIYVTSRVK